jgi:hypothetical protein
MHSLELYALVTGSDPVAVTTGQLNTARGFARPRVEGCRDRSNTDDPITITACGYCPRNFNLRDRPFTHL